MDVVVVGGGPWSPDTNFPTHQTARLLAKQHRVLYLCRDSHVSLLGRAAGRLPGFHSWTHLLKRAGGSREVLQVDDQLWVSALSGPSAALPLSYPPVVRNVSKELVLRQLQWAIRTLGFSKPVLWFYWWFFPELVLQISHRIAVYDIYDDHSEYDYVRRDPRRQRYTRRLEWELLKNVDLAFAVSHKLQRERADSCDVRYLPNGVDMQVAQAARESAIPDEMLAFPRPIIGYLGGYDSRLNWPLVETMADAHPEWSFVFVGGGYTCPDRAHPNLHLLGNRSYPEAMRYVNAFDVALIPFVRDALTEAICPAKLFDYLALGKPTVSSPLPAINEVVGAGEEVYRADSPDEFVRQAERALAEPESLSLQRRSLASSLTWQHRVDTAMHWIENALETPGPPNIRRRSP